MPKHETRNIFHWITWVVAQSSSNEALPVYVRLQKKNVHQKIQQNKWPENYFQDHFYLKKSDLWYILIVLFLDIQYNQLISKFLLSDRDCA